MEKELVNSLMILESMRVLRNKCREEKAKIFDCIQYENVKGTADKTVPVNNEEREVLMSAGFEVEAISLYRRATSKVDLKVKFLLLKCSAGKKSAILYNFIRDKTADAEKYCFS